MRKTIIFGTGGHAKVVIELLRQDPTVQLLGCLAPASTASSHIGGLRWLGEDTELETLVKTGINSVFVAIGDNRLRRRLATYAQSLGCELLNAISAQANVSPSARLGQGVAIMHGANIGPDASLGDGVIVNSNASVDHDCRLFSYCHIGPGATLAGCVEVGSESFVATGSSVIPHQRIGERALVGAGSVVVRPIPDDSIAYGVPARIRKRVGSPSPPAPLPSSRIALSSPTTEPDMPEAPRRKAG